MHQEGRYGLDDTDPEARRVQLDLLRRASIAQRLHLAFSLSQSVIDLSRANLARLYPADSAVELKLRFVALHYGPELARELRRHLQECKQ